MCSRFLLNLNNMNKIFIFQEPKSKIFRIRIGSDKDEFLNQIITSTDPATFNDIKSNILEWKEYCKHDTNKSHELDENFDFKNKRIDFIYDSLDGKSQYNIYINDSNIRGITEQGLLKKKYSGNFNYVLRDLIQDIKLNTLEFED